jgi:hypothetical protein
MVLEKLCVRLDLLSLPYTYLNSSNESAEEVVARPGLGRRDGQAVAVLDVPDIRVSKQRSGFRLPDRGLRREPRHE